MTHLQRVRDAIAGVPHGDALLVTTPATVRWATGFEGSFGMLLVSGARAVFVTDSRYKVAAEAGIEGYDVETFAAPQTAKGFLKELVERLGLRLLGFEASGLTYAAVEEYREALGVELVPVRDVLSDLRMVKSEEEIGKIRACCALADAAFAHVGRAFQAGATEFDIQLELEFFLRRQRAELAFDPIVVSGPNSARPHGRATERKLQSGDFLTLDFGARMEGYNSDLTRTVVIGEASPRHREVYGQVLKGQLAALEMMKPGVRAHDVDAAVRAILDEDGKDLARHFGHSLGHGLGTLVHDAGKLGPNSTHVLAEGQVWTVEPGVYLEGFGGVRIEDDVVLRAGGVEILTKTTKELLVFGD